MIQFLLKGGAVHAFIELLTFMQRVDFRHTLFCATGVDTGINNEQRLCVLPCKMVVAR
jgi:hypothetical protein